MIYFAPTKLYIDYEAKTVGSIIKEYGYQKVLVVYGSNSAKKSGILDEAIHSLEENGITYYLAGGVKPNPEVSFVRDILNKKLDIDFILAIGGGSVIDTAKSIAVSFYNDNDPWDYNMKIATPNKVLRVGVILTIAAAGSEMSNSCVITNPDTNTKRGFNSDLVRPLFAIMNPKYTYSVSKYQTACGIVDIMMHTLERYINDNQTALAQNLSLGLLKSVYEAGSIAYNDSTNYEARKTLMLASSFSHNGLTSIGVPNYFRAHQFEHVISGFYPDVAHGAGLAICFPAYAKYVYKNEIALPLFAKLAYQVFDIKKSSDMAQDAYLGILKMEEFFKSLGMPTRMEDLAISKDNLIIFTDKLTNNGTHIVPDFITLDYDTCLKIFEGMWS